VFIRQLDYSTFRQILAGLFQNRYAFGAKPAVSHQLRHLQAHRFRQKRILKAIEDPYGRDGMQEMLFRITTGE